jgi:hypothetical protein
VAADPLAVQDGGAAHLPAAADPGVSETIKSAYAARTGIELEHKEKAAV